jgi:signal transduction histidine kinase
MLKRLFSWVKKQYQKLELKPSIKIIIVNNIVTIVIAFMFYYLLPIILNYPPFSVNTDFQVRVTGIKYIYQYLIIVSLTIVLMNIFLLINLRKLDKWKVYLESENSTEIERIRVKCHTFPYTLYLVSISFPVLITAMILLFIKTNPILIFKVICFIFTFTTLIALISHIFSDRIFTKILINISHTHRLYGSRIGLRNKIFMQVFPAFLVAVTFTTLVCYTRLITEKGDLMYESYYMQLNERFADRAGLGRDEITDILKTIPKDGDHYFIIGPDKTAEPEEISDNKFFLNYLYDIAFTYTNGHVYDYYGVDSQAAAIRLQNSEGSWIIGVKYEVKSTDTLEIIGTCFLILVMLYALVLRYLSKSLADDISRVANNLNDVVHGEDVDLDRKLPVTSNDEIGDLVVAFNKILDLAKDNIRSIKENQAILIEQERLASLGQLIGGIAHNLKTPIMSISGGIEALKDLAYEYRDSIGDRSVTDEDHKEIANEMLTWLDKMKPYCAYMSDVISAVKGQAVRMISTNTVKFTVDEVIKRVELLLKHELKRYHCILNINSHVDAGTEIKGEVNNLVQVFDNIIINAMQAYDGENGAIDLDIVRSGDNVEFTFRDYAKGIPKNVADRLFKEMITTKGKNGTGLGLYMSYATIRGRFGGNMSFVTKEGCGTTFFISIPCITYGNQEEV